MNAKQPHTITKSYPSKYDKNPSIRAKNKLSIQKLGLSSAGNRVFQLLYLLMLENPKKDKLYFHFSTVPKPSMISLTTFKEGVNELLAKEVIYKSTQDFTFFVNVNYLIGK
jgi:hypothetical protein